MCIVYESRSFVDENLNFVDPFLFFNVVCLCNVVYLYYVPMNVLSKLKGLVLKRELVDYDNIRMLQWYVVNTVNIQSVEVFGKKATTQAAQIIPRNWWWLYTLN